MQEMQNHFYVFLTKMNNMSSQTAISDKPNLQVILQCHPPVTFKSVKIMKVKGRQKNSSWLKDSEKAQ